MRLALASSNFESTSATLAPVSSVKMFAADDAIGPRPGTHPTLKAGSLFLKYTHAAGWLMLDT